MQEQAKPIPAREMHKYVFAFVGVFIAIAVSYPIAFLRVSQNQKFAGFHVKSLTVEGKLENSSAESVAVVPDKVAETSVSATTANPIIASSSTENKQTSKSEATVNVITPVVEINEPDRIKELNRKVYDRVAQVWQAGRSLKQAVAYRVTVTGDGEIAALEPIDRVALDYLSQTSLPSLLKQAVPDGTKAQVKAVAQQALGEFRVVFTRRGILEVSPWHGWKKSR